MPTLHAPLVLTLFSFNRIKTCLQRILASHWLMGKEVLANYRSLPRTDRPNFFLSSLSNFFSWQKIVSDACRDLFCNCHTQPDFCRGQKIGGIPTLCFACFRALHNHKGETQLGSIKVTVLYNTNWLKTLKSITNEPVRILRKFERYSLLWLLTFQVTRNWYVTVLFKFVEFLRYTYRYFKESKIYVEKIRHNFIALH